MRKKKAEDLGTKFASHYTPEENVDKPLPPSAIEEIRKERQNEYATIARDYYDLTTDNLENGWGPHFMFAPFPDPCETMPEAIKRHQHFLALMMSLKPGMRGLDAGSGTGGPSRSIARFAGVHITGISINKLHVDRATQLAKDQGLLNSGERDDGGGKGGVTYLEGDFMHIPFPDDTFDFVYATEATVYAPSLHNVYTEIARVLKPNGVFAVYEWLMTPSFMPTNPRHLAIRQRIERGDGVTNLHTVEQGLAAITCAGLTLEHHEDMALRGTDEKRWWYPCDGDVSKTSTVRDWWLVFRLKESFWRVGYGFSWCVVQVGLAPKRILEALNTQGMSVFGLRDGAKEGIFTPMYLMVGRKPERWVQPGLSRSTR